MCPACVGILSMWAANSIAIALLAAGFVVLSGALVAFGSAYFRFPGRKVLFGLVLATMMLSGALTMVPQYLIWLNLGLVGTWVPLFGANLFGSAFYIFLQRQFFLGLPRELFEAARVDGASYLGLSRRIALPLSVPSLVIIFLFEFQASWNGLQAALIYLNAGTVEGFTVPLRDTTGPDLRVRSRLPGPKGTDTRAGRFPGDRGPRVWFRASWLLLGSRAIDSPGRSRATTLGDEERRTGDRTDADGRRGRLPRRAR